jgi:hypothetical protein
MLAEDEFDAESDGRGIGTLALGGEILLAAFEAAVGGVPDRPGTPARSAASWGGKDAAKASASSTFLPIELEIERLRSCTTASSYASDSSSTATVEADNPSGLETVGVVMLDMLPNRLFLRFLSPSFIGGDTTADDSKGGPSIVVIGEGKVKLIEGVLDRGTIGV